ncbi:protein of unknown function [Streptomyces murinus]
MSRSPAARGSEGSPEPDISFEATVRGDRLRFAQRPRTAVGFPGDGERESSSRSERTHLPDRVAPGREYRDVYVAYRLATRLLSATTGTNAPGGRRSRRAGRGSPAATARARSPRSTTAPSARNPRRRGSGPAEEPESGEPSLSTSWPPNALASFPQAHRRPVTSTERRERAHVRMVCSSSPQPVCPCGLTICSGRARGPGRTEADR